ncbi:MAG: CDP-diacylglycerol--glycerol-3-phosphate 3-phosphatidyltransferase [Hydrogenibacillus sp.]|nr:CDP-diacylglycerol--glycerol-3-phosphate 3-phosphatidyltransferase [Hydrogenibacillus sp.]
MNWPNRLTLLRLLITMVLIALLQFGPGADGGVRVRDALAAVLFLIAALSDWLDGWMARRYGLVTNFGKFLDPLVDKILVIGVLVVLVELGRIPAWGVDLIILREFAVSGLRMLAAAEGRVIAAGAGGKLKTAVQLAAVFLLILTPDGGFGALARGLFWVSVALTFLSGVQYFLQNRTVLDTKGVR